MWVDETERSQVVRWVASKVERTTILSDGQPVDEMVVLSVYVEVAESVRMKGVCVGYLVGFING